MVRFRKKPDNPMTRWLDSFVAENPQCSVHYVSSWAHLSRQLYNLGSYTKQDLLEMWLTVEREILEKDGPDDPELPKIREAIKEVQNLPDDGD